MEDITLITHRFENVDCIARSSIHSLYRCTESASGEATRLRMVGLSSWLTPLESASLRRRFARVARTVAEVRHPRILGVTKVEEGDAVTLAWRPEIAGKSLRDLILERGAISGLSLCNLVRDYAEALEALHSAGLRHGHITPENLLVDQWGRGVLADPCLSVATRSFEISGVECELGKASRVDLVDLSAALFEACAGKAPRVVNGRLQGGWNLPTYVRSAFEQALTSRTGGYRSATDLAEALQPAKAPTLFEAVWRPAAAAGLVLSLGTLTPSAFSAGKSAPTAAQIQAGVRMMMRPVATVHSVESISPSDRAALELAIRREGVAVLAHPVVAEVFRLSDGQINRVQEILDAQRNEIAAQVEAASQGKPVDVAGKLSGLRIETHNAIVRMLTEKQREMYQELSTAAVPLNGSVL